MDSLGVMRTKTDCKNKQIEGKKLVFNPFHLVTSVWADDSALKGISKIWPRPQLSND